MVAHGVMFDLVHRNAVLCSKLCMRLLLLQPIDDSRTLGEVGFTSSTAKAQTPATVGLVFRQDGKSPSYLN